MGISGNLKTMVLSELLQWLSMGQKTGTLVIDNKKVEKRVCFDNGVIISSASTDPKEYLGRFLVNHGFLEADREQMAGLLARPELSGALAGFVFRLTLDMAPWETAATASRIAAGLGVAASLHLRMCGANPAQETADDHSNAVRIAEAMAAAAAFDNVTVYADTFADIDRGYFPRTGVVDRLYNPRAAALVVRHINAALDTVEGAIDPGAAGDCPGGRYVELRADGGPIRLALPDAQAATMSVPFGAPRGRLIDLSDGGIAPVATGTDGAVTVDVPFYRGIPVPMLILPA